MSTIAQTGKHPPPVQVVAIRVIQSGNLKALIDVQLGTSLTIRQFRVIQQPGQRPWVSAPQREWMGDDGKRHFAPIVEFAGDLKSRVEQAILAAWQDEGVRHVG